MSQPNRYRPRPNTYRVDNIVIDDYAHLIGPMGVAVYNVLARHAERDTGMCFIGIPKICYKLNISRTATKKYLHILFRHGLIAILPQYRDQGGQTANRYLLLDISSEGRTRRAAQLHSLLHPTPPAAAPGGSPNDRPPAQSDHLATGPRSPNDPIQLSYYQDIIPTAKVDEIPAVQRNCPHPPRDVHRLFDGTTICHSCYKLLSDSASETTDSETAASIPKADPSSYETKKTPLSNGNPKPLAAIVADVVAEAMTEHKKTAAHKMSDRR
jgi:hypothetical protein